jgi:ribonucleoside-diphosphate reductase alpha chain
MGPTLRVSDQIHAEKYRSECETFRGAMNRIADGMKDSQQHFHALRDILLDMRFLPGGRIQSAVGGARQVTPINCFVGRTIDDSMKGIMGAATECAQTLRMGGGWGSDFSTIRPGGDAIRSLQSTASGPVSFMHVFNSVCGTVCSAGHRRGAMMGILRVDHPDILKFIRAKSDRTSLTNFNISVAVTNEFMLAVEGDQVFDLRFDGRVYSTVRAVDLWSEIMRSNWDWAEPGVIFIDSVNERNNLHYCETIASTNPCAEQPLPPFGACLLGSFNLVRYVFRNGHSFDFEYEQFRCDIPHVVRAMDNIIDGAIYPLPEQQKEEMTKRRMGLGVTGAANAIEAIGFPYGSAEFLQVLATILEILRREAYRASCQLADERGSFELFDAAKYCDSAYVQELPLELREEIRIQGIRNSHLTSIAPTGTISMTADNISSGIEPVFAHEYERTLITPDGPQVYQMQDYGLARFGVRGVTAMECSVDAHLDVLCTAQKYVDSAVSKTCNVGPEVTWEEFQQLYFKAWRNGAKSCSTFRPSGERAGILKAKEKPADGQACRIDPQTGAKTCDA